VKKLHHDQHLVIDGPDGAAVGHCLQDATVAAGLAAVVAAFVTAGAALPAAEQAFQNVLLACLGGGFSMHFDDHSY
jgi:hypothetical protein